MGNLESLFQAFLVEPAPEIKRGRPRKGRELTTGSERKRQCRQAEKEDRIRHIAVMDSETDPFDNKSETEIHPFLVVIYSDEFLPIIIWDENFAVLKKKVIEAIEALPDSYTIFAHNGGKFDFMFWISELRGEVKFKGRGIMAARIGNHELRDSFHIIPEKLANFKKDHIDYELMKKGNRRKHKQEIIKYCLSDCRYLLDIVKSFVAGFGLKISIGQAAMSELKKHYKVERMCEIEDREIRQYFFGGRVECLAGAGHFVSGFGESYKLYDVNSMYPYVMANRQHPISSSFIMRSGKPNANTIFLDLNCRNYGALVKRAENNETTATAQEGFFRTTIWEYEMALRYDLIDNVHVIRCIDFPMRSNFAEFVNPLYEKRLHTKELMRTLQEGTTAFNDVKKDDIFYKLILNNAFGKFAQNPRNFKEHYLTEPDEMPPEYWFMNINEMPDAERERYMVPAFESDAYWIWSKPSPHFRFNNVATAASITGAARAQLMQAIQLSDDPIYCDTDSVICRNLRELPTSPTELGAWDIEKELDEILIAGKKLYAFKVKGIADGQPGQIKIKSKGVSDLNWEAVQAILDGEIRECINKTPTITRYGTQFYMRRNVRRTAQIIRPNSRIHIRELASCLKI